MCWRNQATLRGLPVGPCVLSLPQSGPLKARQAHADSTTGATQLLIKIFYFRRPLKKRLSTLDRRPNNTLGLFLSFLYFFFFKSTKTI